MNQSLYAAALGRGTGPVSVWPPSPREPLPAFPQPTEDQPSGPGAGCWTYDAFDAALPFTPPASPDLDFHRGNVMGLRVPGAPFVPGGTDRDPSLIVTWFLYLYSPEWQARILDAYQAAGYTHIDFHRAAWMGNLDSVPGCTQDAALALVKACADRGLFVISNLAIDNGPPDPNELKSWIDALSDAGMRIGCLAWQADQRMPPGDWCDYINWAAPYLHAKGCKVAAHYITDACAWWSDENDDNRSGKQYDVWNRFDFQRWTADKIDYPYQQYNTEAPILDTRPRQGGLLGEARDVLRSLCGQKLVAAEYDMQAEFDDPANRLEVYGDLKGRCLMTATYGDRRMWGYLNGGRQPDGSVL